jgi:hypothetical protein
MNKTVMYIFVSIGSMVGAHLPSLFGADGFSAWTILGSTIGGLIGIYLAVKQA